MSVQGHPRGSIEGRDASTPNKQRFGALLVLRSSMTLASRAVLPDAAGVRSDHLLTGLAVEGLTEFLHVRGYVIDAEYWQGVGIGGDDHARDLWTYTGAPGIGVREKESLTIGPAVLSFIIERLALLF